MLLNHQPPASFLLQVLKLDTFAEAHDSTTTTWAFSLLPRTDRTLLNDEVQRPCVFTSAKSHCWCWLVLCHRIPAQKHNAGEDKSQREVVFFSAPVSLPHFFWFSCYANYANAWCFTMEILIPPKWDYCAFIWLNIHKMQKVQDTTDWHCLFACLLFTQFCFRHQDCWFLCKCLQHLKCRFTQSSPSGQWKQLLWYAKPHAMASTDGFSGHYGIRQTDLYSCLFMHNTNGSLSLADQVAWK